MDCRSIFVAVGFGLVLSGCDKLPLSIAEEKPNFLLGTWILDREKTMEAFSENTMGGKPEGIAGQLAAAALQKSAEKLIQPLDNVKYTFTETQYSERIGKYEGKTKSYEIIARPSADVIKTRDEAGIVNVYHLDGLNVWYNLRGQEKLKIYLRASN